MKIKTYRAPTMQDALKAIKAELGPDAVILTTKPLPQGNNQRGLPGRTMIEVTAAVDLEHIVSKMLADQRAGACDATAGSEHLRDDKNVSPPFDELLRSSMNRQAMSGKPGGDPEPTPAQDDVKEGDWARVLAELKQIKASLRHDGDAGASVSGMDLAPHYKQLLEAGLDAAVVESLIEEVRRRIHGAPASAASVLPILYEILTREVKTSGPLLERDGSKKTVILIGPTGVGKTTTIAKLAAYYQLQERRRVALITLDTYRLAAVEQLRLYANLIGVGLDVALTRREALDCIKRRQQAELILIDTAGRNPRDAAGMEELKELLSLGHPVEVHLVLSATTRERDLVENIKHYRGIPVSRLLFTKLDETGGFGGVFNLMRQTGLPLSYFSTGQRVPEDLEVVRPERLAELLLDGVVRALGEPTHIER